MAQARIDDISAALFARALPTVTRHNRLEGRPRSPDVARSLRAEVRDGLWMLSRQWQLGEFQGEDVGQPVFAKLMLEQAELDRYQAGTAAPKPYANEMPLETRAEARPLRFEWDGRKMRFTLRVQCGRQWRKLLDKEGLGTLADQYRALYPLEVPPNDGSADHVHARSRDWQQAQALARGAIDGGALLKYLMADSAHGASAGVTSADSVALDALGRQFVAWFKRLYFQPEAPDADAWQPERLEYDFACAGTTAAGNKVLSADEYHQGRLDWYSFDVDRDTQLALDPPSSGSGFTSTVSSFIPTPVSFDGMPNARFWAFEDGKTNFGQLSPTTSDIGQLLLLEFGLVYSADWFLLPLPATVGSISNVTGLVVTNTFGERFWIQPAAVGRDEAWWRFSMFSHAVKGDRNVRAETMAFLAPTVPDVQEGLPEEEIHFLKDEMANMVWAVQTVVPTVTGVGTAGKEFADALQKFHAREVVEEEAEYQAPDYYRAQSGVSEHWVPFIPVREGSSNREIKLQRGRMLRYGSKATEPVTISPRTTLLRAGLDATPRRPYYIHEEEVPREGARVTQRFERTRWHDGHTFVWLGVRKQAGRGERSSGLAFDEVVRADPEST